MFSYLFSPGFRWFVFVFVEFICRLFREFT